MRDILELEITQLREVLAKWQEPSFRAGQIFSWIYKKGIRDFDQMTDLSRALKDRLKKDFFISGLELVQSSESIEGTNKLLLKLRDQNLIEAVNIPAKERITACLSTQAGCCFKCLFCASGVSGFKRNLSVAEITGELLFLKDNLKGRDITHVVFMGMGEPLDNYNNVMLAVRRINSKDAFCIGARRITISTCGIIPGIEKLMDEGLQVELSISLHAADDKTRSHLMPVNRVYPLDKLILACKKYIKKTNRQITFEYTMIKDFNSDLQNARNLSKILRGLNCKVNLIPANYVKELKVEPPNKLDLLFFRDQLVKSGLNVTVRKSRGSDIEAACGQLRLKYDKNRL